MMVDLPSVKEEFASIIQKITVQPWTMLQFIVWLDVKLAEYKINGYMVLDQSCGSIPEWLMNLDQLYPSQKSADIQTNSGTIEQEAEVIEDDGDSSDDVKILPGPSTLRNPAERLPSIQNIAQAGMRKESSGRRFGDRTSQRQPESTSDPNVKRSLPSDARFNPSIPNVYAESKRRKVLRTPPFASTPGKSPTSVSQISRPDLSRVSFLEDNNLQQSESYSYGQKSASQNSEDNSNFSSYPPSRQSVTNKERKISSTITRPQPGTSSMSNSPMFNYGETDRLIARQYSDDSTTQADDTLSQESQFSTQETLAPTSITSPNAKGRPAEPVPTQLFRNNIEINKSQTDQSAVSTFDPTFPGDSREDSSSFPDLPGDMQIKTEAPDNTRSLPKDDELAPSTRDKVLANVTSGLNPIYEGMEGYESNLDGLTCVTRISNGRQKDCNVCSNRNIIGGRRRARTQCSLCGRGLHIRCVPRHKCCVIYNYSNLSYSLG